MNTDVRKRTVFWDISNGEIIKETETAIGIPKVRFKMGNGIGKASKFTKVFHSEDMNFSVDTFYKYFFKCLLNVEQGTNRIVNFTRDGEINIPMDENDLMEIFECSDKTFRRFIKECKEKNIIKKVVIDDKLYGYIISPIYCLNGQYIDIMLYTMFKSKEIDKHIPKADLIKINEYLKVSPMKELKVVGE